jgi:inner membrane protein involved in colicin E2 resistance
MPMSLSHWLFAISFSLYLSSLFCFVYSVINTRPNAINTLAFLLQIVLLLEMLKFSKIIFSKRNVL